MYVALRPTNWGVRKLNICDVRRCQRYQTLYHEKCLKLSIWRASNLSGRPVASGGGGWGGFSPPQFLADQFTLSRPGWAHYPHPLLLAPPDFQTLWRACTKCPILLLISTTTKQQLFVPSYFRFSIEQGISWASTHTPTPNGITFDYFHNLMQFNGQ